MNRIVWMLSTRAKANPNMDDMGPDARHWRCVLRFEDRSMIVPFSQGAAHKDEPTVEDVLSCVISDAMGAFGNTFEEWAGEYGYDTDSRKAERTYETIRRQSADLLRLLGVVSLEAVTAQDEDSEAAAARWAGRVAT